MAQRNLVFGLSSALVMAVGLYAGTGRAEAASLRSCMAGGLSEAECACVFALRKGTESALASFARKYGGKRTACGATASSLVNDDENRQRSRSQSTQNSNNGSPGGSPGSGNPGGSPGHDYDDDDDDDNDDDGGGHDDNSYDNGSS